MHRAETRSTSRQWPAPIIAAIAIVGIVLGATKIGEPFDLPPQKVRVCFVDTPNSQIELLEPLGEDSPIAKFLEKNGEGVHHVCFLTDDLPATLEALAAAEAELIDREPRAGAHGDVAFVHPRTLNGVLWELLDRS